MLNNLRKLGGFVHQSYFVVALCVGIIAGVIIGLVFRVNFFASVGWVGFVVLVLILIYLWPRAVFVGVAFVVGMILAWCRVSSELYGQDYIRQFYGQEVVVSGVVEGDPEEDEGEMKVKLGGLRFGEERIEVRGNIYMTIRTSEIARGDEVTVSGRLSEGFGTYAGYMYKPMVKQVRRPEPGDLILIVRNWFAERIRRLIPEEEVALGLSYLLGMKTGLPDELNENLRTVGLVHIVVASGAHLSILVEVARKIFGRLSRMSGLVFSVLFTVFFMAMVGWTPSILRAGVMVILSLVAWYVGRKFAAWRIILIVAAFTLMLNPMFIINLGWLLSFAAFSGIMVLGPRLNKFFYGMRKPGFVGATIITTVAATLMTLPITLYYYGTVSLISVVANLLILPTLPVAMGLVFMTGVFAGVPLVDVAVAWCATKLLDFHIMVVGWFGEMKWFVVEVPVYQPQVFLIYLPVIILAIAGSVRTYLFRAGPAAASSPKNGTCIFGGPPSATSPAHIQKKEKVVKLKKENNR